MRPAVRERVLSRLLIDPGSDCLLWAGSRNTNGYGQVRDGVRNTVVHRLMYEWFAGPVPAGAELDHLCRVRHCANVAHLEPVSHQENVRRGVSPAAEAAVKTHCVNDHEFTEANTYIDRKGHRYCRPCRAARMRRYKRAARAQKLVTGGVS